MPDVCIVGGRNLPPTIQTSVNFCNLQSFFFTRLRRVTFKLGKFANFRALFTAVSMDFALLMINKSWKTKQGSINLFLKDSISHQCKHKHKCEEMEQNFNNINLFVIFYKINFKRKILKKSADACLFLILFFIL